MAAGAGAETRVFGRPVGPGRCTRAVIVRISAIAMHLIYIYILPVGIGSYLLYNGFALPPTLRPNPAQASPHLSPLTYTPPDNVGNMAYGQWIMLLITNSIETQIRVQNAQLNLQVTTLHFSWPAHLTLVCSGKFYRGGNKDVEIPLAEVDQVGIPWGAEEQLSSCGRSDAAAGTMGFVDLYDEDTKVCRISWSCPWGAYPNTLKIDDYDPERSQYSVQVEHGDFTSGPIGEVFVNITPNN